MQVDSLLDAVQTRIHLHTSLGVDRFRLVEIRGREQISRPYCFRLKLRTDAHDCVTLEEMTGMSVTASFQLPDPHWISVVTSDAPAATRDFCGILSQVSCDGISERERFFTAILRPKLWQLGLNSRFRMFSQKTTREIVTEVLGDLDVVWRLASDTLTHNYCVQYGESDLQFISRLLEEDGLFYFFEHQYPGQAGEFNERCERMVITDSIDAANSDAQENASDETSPNDSAAATPVYFYDDVSGGVRDSMRVRRWAAKHSMVPTTVRSLDRHFQRPGSPADSSNTINVSDAASGTTVVRYPSGVSRRFDDVTPSGDDRDQLQYLNAQADCDARLRAERLKYRAAGFAGAGDAASMSPGKKFKLVRGNLPDATDYYLTRIEHLVRLATGTHSAAEHETLVYRNRFQCRAVTVACRPAPVATKPKVYGVVAATVVTDSSQSDDQVCVDKFGRVKVRFPWQESTDDPSCWVRVSQFWAGPRWGAFFWPRVDHEVLVAFEHGDPDRPVIVGSLYNADNMPPLELPKLKLSCGIHSCTHKGNPLSNTSTLVFHDAKGSEYLELHSETYHSMSSETTDLKWSAGQEIEFVGHHWLFDPTGGSGGGGNNLSGNDESSDALFKMPEADDEDSEFSVSETFKSLFLANDRGAISYTVGDSYSKNFGAEYESKFGCNLWLGCDPVDFAEFVIETIDEEFPDAECFENPLVPATLGACGQGTTLFGGKHDLHYGTAVECHRGYKITKIEPELRTPDDQYCKGNFTSSNLPAKTTCENAVALMLLMDWLMMLLTKAAVSSSGKRWKGIVRFSEMWSLMLLPRIQDLIEYVESTGGEVDDLLTSAKDALADASDSLSKSVRAMSTTDSAAGESGNAVAGKINGTLDGLATCARKIARSDSS